jgi:hypothetical protein
VKDKLSFRSYTAAAEQRLASVAPDVTNKFIRQLSLEVLNEMYKPLPAPKGFRRGKSAVVRQTELLAARLGSKRKNSNKDKMVLEAIWQNVCFHLGLKEYIDDYYENVESFKKDENEEDKEEFLAEADRTLFDEISRSPHVSVSRESFEQILLYSPIASDDEFSKWSKLLKPKEELDKEQAIDQLPEKLQELERREEKLEQLPSDVHLLKEELGKVQENIRTIKESSVEQSHLDKLAVNLEKGLNTFGDQSKSRISGLEEGQLAGKEFEEVATKNMLDLSERLDIASKKISDVLDKVSELTKENSNINEVVAQPPHSQGAIVSSPGEGDSFQRVQGLQSLIQIEKRDDLVAFITSSLRMLGLRNKMALNYCLTSILTSVTAQRILTLSGPMSNHIGLNLATAFGAEYLRWDTRVGQLEDNSNLATNISGAEKLATVLLRDVSLSIPGVLFRQLVSDIEIKHASPSTHFGRFVIATTSDGSVHLPLDSTFLNLTLDLDFSSISIVDPKPLEHSARVETTLLESLLAEAATEVLLDPYEELLAKSPVISFHESKHLKLVVKCLQMYAGYSETKQSLDPLVADVFLSSLLRPRYEEIKDFEEIALNTLSELGVKIEETIFLKRILNV